MSNLTFDSCQYSFYSRAASSTSNGTDIRIIEIIFFFLKWTTGETRFFNKKDKGFWKLTFFGYFFFSTPVYQSKTISSRLPRVRSIETFMRTDPCDVKTNQRFGQIDASYTCWFLSRAFLINLFFTWAWCLYAMTRRTTRDVQSSTTLRSVVHSYTLATQTAQRRNFRSWGQRSVRRRGGKSVRAGRDERGRAHVWHRRNRLPETRAPKTGVHRRTDVTLRTRRIRPTVWA